MGKLRNEKINKLYASTNIIKVINSRRIVRAAYEAPECTDQQNRSSATCREDTAIQTYVWTSHRKVLGAKKKKK
jgi:hypothetical protein